MEGIYRQGRDCSRRVKLRRLRRQIKPCHQDSQCGHQKKPRVGLFVGWWCQRATESWTTIKENTSGASWPVHSVDTHACQQEPNVDHRASVNRLLTFVENCLVNHCIKSGKNHECRQSIICVVHPPLIYHRTYDSLSEVDSPITVFRQYIKIRIQGHGQWWLGVQLS